MAEPNDGQELITRLPTLEDLLFLCRNLNQAGAKYIVIGGWAGIQHGYGRTTQDIDAWSTSTPTPPRRCCRKPSRPGSMRPRDSSAIPPVPTASAAARTQ